MFDLITRFKQMDDLLDFGLILMTITIMILTIVLGVWLFLGVFVVDPYRLFVFGIFSLIMMVLGVCTR